MPFYKRANRKNTVLFRSYVGKSVIYDSLHDWRKNRNTHRNHISLEQFLEHTVSSARFKIKPASNSDSSQAILLSGQSIHDRLMVIWNRDFFCIDPSTPTPLDSLWLLNILPDQILQQKCHIKFYKDTTVLWCDARGIIGTPMFSEYAPHIII